MKEKMSNKYTDEKLKRKIHPHNKKMRFLFLLSVVAPVVAFMPIPPKMLMDGFESFLRPVLNNHHDFGSFLNASFVRNNSSLPLRR